MPALNGTALFTAVTSLTCLGFLLIGYDNGLMGGLVNSPGFKNTFSNPSPAITGLIVAIYEIGCFLGSIATSIFGEEIGRKKSILMGVVIMVIGALLQANSYTKTHIAIARVVAGIGMGFINSTVPVFQAEFSPKATRGLYVCIQLSTLNFGIFLAYWVDYASTQSFSTSFSWRVPTVFQCIFLLPMLGLLAIVPESPRWLAAHDHPDDSLTVLTRLHSSHMSSESIRSLHADILNTCAYEASHTTNSWSDLFSPDAIHSRRRFLISCAIQSFQQLGGINALIYYSNTLFSTSLGFSDHFSALMSGYLQTWFFVASFIPWFLIDRVGRRPLLLSMILLMAIVMVAMTGLVYNVQYGTESARGCGIGAAVMLFVFEGAFTVGFQATVWVYPSEILPLHLRQRGSSISTACNWMFNYLIVQMTPVALNDIGYKTYAIFAVLNACWVPVIWGFFPETRGVQLEDVDGLFVKRGNGAGAGAVHRSGRGEEGKNEEEHGEGGGYGRDTGGMALNRRAGNRQGRSGEADARGEEEREVRDCGNEGGSGSAGGNRELIRNARVFDDRIKLLNNEEVGIITSS